MIACTMPGRFGDILWSLPTVRAIAEANGGSVEFYVSEKYGAIMPLLERQPYIQTGGALPRWQIVETAPITPRLPPHSQAGWVHLGYEGWPTPTLAEDIARRAGMTIDLDRPWITVDPGQPAPGPRVIVGWSEEHFELKVGLLAILAARFRDVQFWWLRPWGGRYDEIDSGYQVRDSFDTYNCLGPHVSPIRCDWVGAATLMATGTVFLGCLSALWVLANALGLPTVIVEPNPQRHHPVFWRESPKNHLVRGGDGHPTFDARHAGDVLQEVLNEQPDVA